MKRLSKTLAAATILLGGTGTARLWAQDQQQPLQQNNDPADQLIVIEQALEQARKAPPGAPVRIKMFGGGQVKKEKAAFLGVITVPVTPAVREQLKLNRGVGLTVEAIEKDSPAEQAGVKQYDVLEKIDDQWLIDAHQLAVLVRMHQPGEEVKLSVIRQGQPMTVAAKLVEKELAVLEGANVLGVPGGEPFGDPFVAPDGSMILRGPMRADIDELVKKFQQNNNNSMTLSMSDDEHTLTLSVRDGQRHLTAIDRDGNVIFNGAINNDEQRKAVPETVRGKLERLESKPGTIRFRTQKSTGGATTTKSNVTQP